MSEDGTNHPDLERFELRGRPRPVTRINRRLVLAVVISGVSVIAGLFVFALQQPGSSSREASELINTETKPYAPGLDSLPKRYDALPPVTITDPAVKKEQPKEVVSQRDILLDADEQERFRLSRQARGAGVFFQLKGTTQQMKPGATSSGNETKSGAGVGEISSTNLIANLPPLPHIQDGTSVANAADPQAQKLAFLTGKADTATLNAHGLQTPVSPT